MNTIYLDNNATTKVAPEVYEEMIPYLTTVYGNPSSLHHVGTKASSALKQARERVAAYLNCRETEVTFTSCGTESNNAALRGVFEAAPGKCHIVTSSVEHSSVLELCKHLEGMGVRVSYIGVNSEGLPDLDELADTITDNTALVSLMYANNETGVIFPMEKIVDVVHERGIPLHVDAIQAGGKLAMDLSKLEIDLLSLSGHKFHGPKGVGILYVRRGTRLRPFLFGGGQEKNRRSGTENIPHIVGFGKACELAESYVRSGVEKTRRLRDKLEEGILSTTSIAVPNGSAEHRLPNTVNVSFDGIEGEPILLLLDEAGICASSGSACTTGAIEPSHVLKAMGVTQSVSHGAVRFSLSRYTTEAEIDTVLTELPPIIQRLCELSEAC